MLSHEIDLREQEHTATAVFRNITEEHIRKILKQLEERLNQGNSEAMKDTLINMVEKIVLDPESLDCKIYYRIPVEDRNKVASPRGCDSIPALPATTQVTDHYRKITSRPRFSKPRISANEVVGTSTG